MDFREIHITQPSQLKYRNKCVSIRTNDQLIDLIPLSEINTIVVDSAQVIFSEPFLIGCQKNHVNLVLTDELPRTKVHGFWEQWVVFRISIVIYNVPVYSLHLTHRTHLFTRAGSQPIICFF